MVIVCVCHIVSITMCVLCVTEECVAEEASLKAGDCKHDVSFGQASGETGTVQNNMGSVHAL
jgi:hypothetical protein